MKFSEVFVWENNKDVGVKGFLTSLILDCSALCVYAPLVAKRASLAPSNPQFSKS